MSEPFRPTRLDPEQVRRLDLARIAAAGIRTEDASREALAIVYLADVIRAAFTKPR